MPVGYNGGVQDDHYDACEVAPTRRCAESVVAELEKNRLRSSIADLQLQQEIASPGARVVDRFCRDAAEWKAETGHMSIVTDMVTHPAYQRIIGLGPPAVPLMIDDMRCKPAHWFWALTAIVGEDHAHGATTVAEAAKMWIDWFDEHWPDVEQELWVR